MIADPTEWVSGTFGRFERPTRWLPSKVVPDEIRRAAALACSERVALLAVKATRRITLEWVVSLGVLTAGRALSIADAKTKASAYADILAEAYPAAVFTVHTLRAAASEFRFFPSFAELVERLDMEVRKLNRERDRLAILARPTPEPEPALIVEDAGTPMPPQRKAVTSPVLSHPLSKEQLDAWARGVDISL